MIRRGSTVAFEVLVSRYHARLLAFCRHLLGSREDAEDVLQEVFSAAFNAMLDDDRPINVRPWLYRIARNRSLNHLRRIQAVGVDSMDIHLYDHGATTADKVHEREEFRLLVDDIQGLPETQRTALVLREMDALSYEQIAEAMETTVPSVKSLLVRARVSLAEAAQARILTCDEVRMELGEVAEGLRRRPGALVRRHLRACERCSTFKGQLNETSKALTAILPVGFAPLLLLRKLAILHIGHSAGAGAGSSASGASAAGQAAAVGSTAAAGATAVMGSTGGGFISASVGAIATKAAAGLAAAALVTAGAVEVEQPSRSRAHHHAATSPLVVASVPVTQAFATTTTTPHVSGGVAVVTHPHLAVVKHPQPKPAQANKAADTTKKPLDKTAAKQTADATTKPKPKPKLKAKPKLLPGRYQTQTDSTVLASGSTPSVAAAGSAGTTTVTDPSTSAVAPPTTTTSSPPTTTTTTSTTTSTPPTSSDPTTSTPPASSDPTTTTPPASSDPGTATTCTPGPASTTSCAPDPPASSSTAKPTRTGGVAP